LIRKVLADRTSTSCQNTGIETRFPFLPEITKIFAKIYEAIDFKKSETRQYISVIPKRGEIR
jgi:hypothetical protein